MNEAVELLRFFRRERSFLSLRGKHLIAGVVRGREIKIHDVACDVGSQRPVLRFDDPTNKVVLSKVTAMFGL